MKNKNIIGIIAGAFAAGILITILGAAAILNAGKDKNDDDKSENGAKAFVAMRDDMEVVSNETNGRVTQRLAVMKVEEAIKPLSQLVTLEYSYKNAGNYKKSTGKGIFKDITTDEFVYIYRGTIKAGIDFSKIEITVDDENRKINLKLPVPEIISHEIDLNSFKTYNVKDSVFTSISPKNVTNQLETLKQKDSKEFLEEEKNLENVTANAKTLIKNFLESSVIAEGYEVVFE